VNQPDLAWLLTVILQAAAAVAVLWICLPDLLDLLGLAFRNGIDGGPSDVEPDGTDPSHEDFHRQLLALGFVPLGRYWEGMRFGKTFQEFAYASEREGCFASMFGLAHKDHHVAFLTTFADGAAVITKNIDGLVLATDDLRAVFVPTNVLADILAEHRRHVGEFRAGGHVPACDCTLEGFRAAESAYYHNRSQRARRVKAVAGNIVVRLVVVAVLFLPMVFLLGLRPHGPSFWLGLLAASAGFILFERWLIRTSMAILSARREEHDARV
jgi:hypothetical protein